MAVLPRTIAKIKRMIFIVLGFQLAPKLLCRQLQRNWAGAHWKIMWLTSCGAPQRERHPLTGLCLFWRLIAEGSLSSVACHTKIHTFSCTLAAHRALANLTFGPRTSLAYIDLNENVPEFSSPQESHSSLKLTLEIDDWRMTRSRDSSSERDMRNPRTTAPDAKMSLTRASGSTVMEKRAGWIAYKGVSAIQEAN